MYTIGLEAFLAVARTLNVSKAAEQLNLAQSTVSKRLKVLENEIGISLFERGQGSKSIHLTPAGEEFIDIAQRWNSLRSEVQSIKHEQHKLSLSIGTLDSLNYALFPPLFRLLSKHQPKIGLTVVTSHSPDLYELVEFRQVDVAFTLLERVHPSITVEQFYREPMVLLRTSSPARLETELVHPQELDPQNELYLSSGLSYQIWHDQWWDPLTTRHIRLDTAQLIFSFLCDEHQWAIVPLSVAKMAKSRGNFSMFNLSEPPPNRITYKIVHKYPKASKSESLQILDHYLSLCITQKS